MQLFDKRLNLENGDSPSQLRFRHQNGSYRTLETVSNNLMDHPAVKGLVINARPTTVICCSPPLMKPAVSLRFCFRRGK